MPFGSVAEINGMLHVGHGNRMFQLKEGAWEGENHDLGFLIGSVFECEGKGYVMRDDRFGVCKSIFECKSKTRDLELLTKIPYQYQLNKRSAIGHNGNIYLVGGYETDRIDCFDIKKREWSPIKKLKNERSLCSLAVVEDKLFVGGGRGERNSVECFSMEKQIWIDVKPSTKTYCQLSSCNGKLVATGGWYRSSCVELYDELLDEWLPMPPMNEGRVAHGAAGRKKDNEIIVVGDWVLSTQLNA